MAYREPARATTRRRPTRTTTRPIRIRRIRVAVVLVVVAAIAAALGYRSQASSPSTSASPVDVPRSDHGAALGEALPSTVWPADGQTAVQIGQSQVHAGPNQDPAAIASVAKVMTAYLVLRDHPLRPGQAGPTITLTAADAADTDRRRRQQESVVSTVAGEQLTELQALQALLLPSANNIAAVLARWDAGSASRFVVRMNAAARSLGMKHTRYTDPSGYDDATVSTAADQVRLVDRAMRLPVFAHIVATPSVTLPVAGAVHNTNRLLGRDGFVGVKTGNTNAAGGCFAFRAIRWIGGKRTTITGVVLGQRDLATAIAAADAMVDRISGQPAAPVPQHPARPPGALPRIHGRQRTDFDAIGRRGRSREENGSAAGDCRTIDFCTYTWTSVGVFDGRGAVRGDRTPDGDREESLMATEEELRAEAAANARATTISWDDFLEQVRTQPGFDYRSTRWYAAGADLEQLKSIPPSPRPLPPVPGVSTAQARIFLAGNPLDCLAAPSWMVPVCTADAGYRRWYTTDAIAQLRAHFGRVEAWCDCRPPGAGTAYSEALAMVDELGLDGAWGQCETTAEFDHAYEAGARRMVGSIDANVLDDRRLARVASGEVLVSIELYRNIQPNLMPDWRNANAGVGGHCIACYESDTEGAVYTPVSSYRELGYYAPKRDSVYAVGLTADDWQALG